LLTQVAVVGRPSCVDFKVKLEKSLVEQTLR
jgi:hypothetical protein